MKTANQNKQNQQNKEPVTIRVYGKVVPAGTSKSGKPYDAFVAWKVAVAKKKQDLRFTKDTVTDELTKCVLDGICEEFDVTVKDFWQMDKDKTQYPVYYAREIIGEPVAYTDKELPF